MIAEIEFKDEIEVTEDSQSDAVWNLPKHQIWQYLYPKYTPVLIGRNRAIPTNS